MAVMRYFQKRCCFLLVLIFFFNNSYSQSTEIIQSHNKVTLPEAHIGNLEIDTRLLDSYELLQDNVRQFYLDARIVFAEKSDVDFSDPEILIAAQKHNISLMGGPMLGNLKEDEIILWLRPSAAGSIVVKVSEMNDSVEKTYIKDITEPGVEQRLKLDGLSSNSYYIYSIYSENQEIAEGSFRTAPAHDEKSIFRLVFGSCFHKIGLHNPNLASQILKRKPHAMMLLGDIAVDDRENDFNMHRSDYLLRDVSGPWQRLAANIPLYTSWDDHDYLNNDLSGIPDGFTEADREMLRKLWRQNWNNPEDDREGIFFNTRAGPVELIMLDTRSCRNPEERGKYGSYLGMEQLNWLKDILKKSAAPFKIISSGTMWSDYISNGKDSWGTWDTLAREEVFSLIETENIPGVLLISGDRHGARGFTIPRSSGFKIYEFEAASLGGVPGPDAMADDPANQLFGYHGTDLKAFGEFTFDTEGDEPLCIFRLIDESGTVLEEYSLKYSQLTPK